MRLVISPSPDRPGAGSTKMISSFVGRILKSNDAFCMKAQILTKVSVINLPASVGSKALDPARIAS